jgi:hypothetical protein
LQYGNITSFYPNLRHRSWQIEGEVQGDLPTLAEARKGVVWPSTRPISITSCSIYIQNVGTIQVGAIEDDQIIKIAIVRSSKDAEIE